MPSTNVAAEVVRQTASTTPSHATTKQTGTKRRVLLVEDDFISAFTTEYELTDAGYQVIGVESLAGDAIRCAQYERPDLILMDVCLLGKRDGVDAAIEIYRTTGIRVIFATATFNLETRKRAEAARPLGWLLKPYTRQSLFHSVTTALQQLAGT